MTEKKYLDEKDVSRITGFKLPTLRNHRHLGLGIPYIKAGRRAVRYSMEDIVTYMESHKIIPEENSCSKVSGGAK